jgi:hypothetical protein
LRELREGYIYIFVTQSFEAKFKSKMYTQGKVDDREWSSSKGSFMSGKAWCKEQCFDPSLGFADEGWGFTKGEEASGILDWERRHLASVSKQHGLQAVFISTASESMNAMEQVAKPIWYPYDGLEAPLGIFVYLPSGASNGTHVYEWGGRMVPAEEADAWNIGRDEKRRGVAVYSTCLTCRGARNDPNDVNAPCGTCGGEGSCLGGCTTCSRSTWEAAATGRRRPTSAGARGGAPPRAERTAALATGGLSNV